MLYAFLGVAFILFTLALAWVIPRHQEDIEADRRDGDYEEKE